MGGSWNSYLSLIHPSSTCLCPSSPSSSTISTFSSVCCFSIFHYLLCSSSPCRLTTFLPTHKAQCCANKHCQWQPLLYCREISGLKRAQFWTLMNMRWYSAFNSRLISHAVVKLISFFFIYLCTSSAHTQVSVYMCIHTSHKFVTTKITQKWQLHYHQTFSVSEFLQKQRELR